ncbi:hypothetical protein ACFW9F_01585 [Streptomyces sp. NPDC059506]|uniref:hypothetical protein n=1 Tax=Streptomyces TaxID=1883 RepID=UPI000CBD67D5|nr:hypothetical protein [Streptomyces sp. SCUT-3]PLW66927.1 hypothetical protein C0036_21605 [Streptomyces sp. DJ]QMV21755.1 hypothetical protein GQS52_08115 [Streptomyces sp. SCUT-3]
MAAESGEEAERDPVESFIDEVFEEMVREAGLSHSTGAKYSKDPLTAALVEAAVASLSKPGPSRASELERMFFAQSLATALAEALAPALSEALATEIMKVLNQHASSGSDNKARSTSAGQRPK